jgi:pyridoxal phosphate enzyme (YggS family)
VEEISEAEAAARLAQLRQNVDQALLTCGRPKGTVKILAVSKTFPVSQIEIFRRCGQLVFGENYVREARDKIPNLPSDLQWHFIGHLQVNKAKHVASLFSALHSLDSLELAAELDKRLKALTKIMPVFIQVNVSGEESKSGLRPEGLPSLLEGLAQFSNLSPQGLMTMAPFDSDPERGRPYYKRLRELRDSAAPWLTQLSMGMSADYRQAIYEGATIVRVGTALFGPRAWP